MKKQDGPGVPAAWALTSCVHLVLPTSVRMDRIFIRSIRSICLGHVYTWMFRSPRRRDTGAWFRKRNKSIIILSEVLTIKQILYKFSFFCYNNFHIREY